MFLEGIAFIVFVLILCFKDSISNLIDAKAEEIRARARKMEENNHEQEIKY